MKIQRTPYWANAKRITQSDPIQSLSHFEEQTASTVKSNEQGWLMLALLLTVFIVSLYWFNAQQNDQPAWSDQPLIEAQAGVEQSIPFNSNEPMLTDPETLKVQAMAPAYVPGLKLNERLVRRFYEEVLNHGHEMAMPYLFAGQVTFQACDGTPTSISAVEFTRRLVSEQRRFHHLTYTIEHIIVDDNRVSVSWSAADRLTEQVTGEPSLTWTGLTVWQIANDRIVAGRGVNIGDLC